MTNNNWGSTVDAAVTHSPFYTFVCIYLCLHVSKLSSTVEAAVNPSLFYTSACLWICLLDNKVMKYHWRSCETVSLLHFRVFMDLSEWQLISSKWGSTVDAAVNHSPFYTFVCLCLCLNDNKVMKYHWRSCQIFSLLHFRVSVDLPEWQVISEEVSLTQLSNTRPFTLPCVYGSARMTIKWWSTTDAAVKHSHFYTSTCLWISLNENK